MAHIFNPAKAKLLNATIDLDTHDIRALLVMTNTTADTEQDAEFIGSLTTLDEMDGSAYVRKTLANEAVTADLTNNRGEFDADDLVWTTLGAGTRAVAGLVLYRFVTNDADSPLIAYIDSGGFPFTAAGGDLTIQWSSEGILQAS